MSSMQNKPEPKWLSHLKGLDSKIYQMTYASERDTIESLRAAQSFFQNLVVSENWRDFMADAESIKFLLNDFCLSTAKNLIGAKQFQTNEALEISNGILELIVQFIIKTFNDDHPRMLETLKIIFDSSKIYYKYNNQDDLNVAPYGKQFKTTTERCEWIQSLKVGDAIDVVKEAKQYKLYQWSRGNINEITNNSIRITYMNDESQSKWIEKTSFDFLPVSTKTADDWDWRFNLKKGDIIDVLDTQSIWYNSTVLETKEKVDSNGQKIKQVYVGYRIYTENGTKSDDEGRKFVGWSRKYDDWFIVTSPRIQKSLKYSKKLYISPSNKSPEDQIEDSSDNTWNIDDSTKYAITRHLHCKSTVLVHMVNQFGEMGGFTNILNRIENKETWCPIDVVSYYILILGNIAPILHRDFCLSFVPRLKNAVFESILESPENNIRNFTKEKVDAIINGLDPLLKRAYSLGEKYEMIEVFSLKVALQCFNTPFLDKRLQGFKNLGEISRNIRVGLTHYLTFSDVVALIKKEDILNRIYAPGTHPQLISRSGELLKTLLSADSLGPPEIDIVWNIHRKGDQETKNAVITALKEISMATSFKNQHIEIFIEKISDSPINEVTSDEIEFLYDIIRGQNKNSNTFQLVLDFLWKLIIARDQTSNDVAEAATNRFIEINKMWDLKEERVTTLVNCVEALKDQKAGILAIKIIKKIIENYSQSNSIGDKFTRGTCIDWLVEKQDLINIIITNIKEMKKNLRPLYLKAQESKLRDVEIDKELSFDGYSYLSNISERITLLSFALTKANSPSIKVTYEILSEAWNITVVNSYINKEKDCMHEFMKEINPEGKSALDPESLIKFFNEQMCPYYLQSGLNEEAFNSFKGVFIQVNEKLGKLRIIPSTTTTTYPTNYYSHVECYSCSYGCHEKKDTEDMEVKVEPDNLEGMLTLYDMIIGAENIVVAEKAIEFLNLIYSSVVFDLGNKKDFPQEDLLSKCKNILIQTLSSQAPNYGTFITKIQRCVQLIKSILDETEKKGVGELKSHNCLVQGELININVTNEISISSDVPRRLEMKLYSNITVYELRVKIGKEFKVTWDNIKLNRGISNTLIKDTENGQTLSDLKIKNGENLTASKRPSAPIPRATLLIDGDKLNPKAEAIFKEWFAKFSTNGLMNTDQCGLFIHSCTNDHCKGDDRRVAEVFERWDTDKDGFLTEQNFMAFYDQAVKERPAVVWNNLASHHYREDLKKVTEVEEEKVVISKLARYHILNDEIFFSTILKLIDIGGLIAAEGWSILSRLPTSPSIFKQVITFKEGKEKIDWNIILPANSSFKLIYNLYIIEYLMGEQEEGDDKDQLLAMLTKNDPQLIDLAKNFRDNFILNNGFDQIISIFMKYSGKQLSAQKAYSPAEKVFENNILAFTLKIIRNYILALFTPKVKSIHRYISFIKFIHLPLDFISKNLDSDYSITNLTEESNDDKIVDGNKDKNCIELETYDVVTMKPITSSEHKTDEQVAQSNQNKKKQDLKYKVEETKEFRALVNLLNGSLGLHILSTIDLYSLISILTQRVYTILLNVGELESEERLFSEYSLGVIVAILLYSPECLEKLHNNGIIIDENNKISFEEFMLAGLYTKKGQNIRKYFTHSMYLICRYGNNNNVTRSVLQTLLMNLPDTSKDRKDCHQFFELLCKIIEELQNPKNDQLAKNIDFEKLFSQVINAIKSHPSSEKRNVSVNDKILIGLLNLAEKIMIVKPQLKSIFTPQDIKNLFIILLFDLSFEGKASLGNYTAETSLADYEKFTIKCKARDSRNAAYKFFVTLAKDSPEHLESILTHCLLKLAEKVPIPQSWNYFPSHDSRGFYGYAGIKNLGAICYMIATLQQFYMIPTFRYALLMANDKKEKNIVVKDKEKGICVDDNLLHQLQSLFAHLELTDRLDYNPHEFCFSMKDHMGQPTNTSIQQDADEFLKSLFDKIETQLKATPFKNIVQGVFGGKMCNKMICESCKHTRNNYEVFLSICLEVKNSRTLYESLTKFIDGEMIDDWNCDVCKQKGVTLHKRSLLSELPNVLMVQFKRFDIDFDTFLNIKINSRMEFPMELDLEEFTEEGIEWREKLRAKREAGATQPEKEDGDNSMKVEDENEYKPYVKHPKEYYEYKLVGIEVHQGTAEFGHYYSFININRNDPRNPVSKDKWLEFNDSMVRDFDVKNIEAECFGGGQNESASDDQWGWAKNRETSKNAYILVYERKIKYSIDIFLDKKQQEEVKLLSEVLNINISSLACDNTAVSSENICSANENASNKIEDSDIIKKEVDFYAFKQFIPAHLFEKIWSDNQKCLLEKHIYNEEFIKFIRNLCDTKPHPEIKSNSICNGIYVDYENFSQNDLNAFYQISSILMSFVSSVLARAQENSLIKDISIKVMSYVSCSPSSAQSLFLTYIFHEDNVNLLKNTIDLLLTSPEKQVRSCWANVLVHIIRIAIHYSKLDIINIKFEENVNKESNLFVAQQIRKFLDYLVSILYTDVTKNWMKFQQYFDFWKDLALSCEPVLEYILFRDIPSYFLDIYLDKKSPISGYPEKKQTIGNRYTAAQMESLLLLIIHIVKRSELESFNIKKNIYPRTLRTDLPLLYLSPNTLLCLQTVDLYEKIIKEKNENNFSVAVGELLEHVCFENPSISNFIIEALLKGVYKSSYDDVTPYLESLLKILTIQDSYEHVRVEAVLGYPQLNHSNYQAGVETKTHFGLPACNNLDSTIYIYENLRSVGEGHSLLQFIYTNKSRWEMLTVVCLRYLLMIALESKIAFNYLLNSLGVTYLHANYWDWFGPFLDNYLQEATKYGSYYAPFAREELGKKCMVYYKEFKEKISSELAEKNVCFPDTIQSLHKNYIVGNVVSENIYADQIISASNESAGINITITEYAVHLMESKPTEYTNLAFPPQFTKGGQILINDIPGSSNLCNFLDLRFYRKNLVSTLHKKNEPASMNNDNSHYLPAHAKNNIHYSDDKNKPVQKASGADAGKMNIYPLLSNPDVNPAGENASTGPAGINIHEVYGPPNPYESEHHTANSQTYNPAGHHQPPQSAAGNPLQHRVAAADADSHHINQPAGARHHQAAATYPCAQAEDNLHQPRDAGQGCAFDEVSKFNDSDSENEEDEKEEEEEEETKEEEEDSNVENTMIEPYILRFVASNNETSTIGFECRIVIKDYSNINFQPVYGPIMVTVKPLSQVTFLTLTKKDPKLGWGDFTIQAIITQIDNNRTIESNSEKKTIVIKGKTKTLQLQDTLD